MTTPIPNAELALMLSGGGARGAYQVGVLRRIARECPAAVPGILTGVSSGGINAAYLGANQEPFAEKLENSPPSGSVCGWTMCSGSICAP
jgi:NTE family protein